MYEASQRRIEELEQQNLDLRLELDRKNAELSLISGLSEIESDAIRGFSSLFAQKDLIPALTLTLVLGIKAAVSSIKSSNNITVDALRDLSAQEIIPRRPGFESYPRERPETSRLGMINDFPSKDTAGKDEVEVVMDASPEREPETKRAKSVGREYPSSPHPFGPLSPSSFADTPAPLIGPSLPSSEPSISSDAVGRGLLHLHRGSKTSPAVVASSSTGIGISPSDEDSISKPLQVNNTAHRSPSQVPRRVEENKNRISFTKPWGSTKAGRSELRSPSTVISRRSKPSVEEIRAKQKADEDKFKSSSELRVQRIQQRSRSPARPGKIRQSIILQSGVQILIYLCTCRCACAVATVRMIRA
jgi:hypothetical protein